MKQKRKHTTIVCQQCGIEKSVRLDAVTGQGQRFCSQKCAGAWAKENVPKGEDHWRYKKVEIDCANCGESMMRLPDEIEISEYLYCNRKCQAEHAKGLRVGENAGNWNGGYVTYPCLECDKDVSRPKNEAEKRKFCSPKCASIYNNRIGNTGGQFEKGQESWNKGLELPPIPLEQKIKQSCSIRGISVDEFDGFVSNERQLFMKQGDYKKWRTSVFERDNYTCNKCKIRGGELHAHHLSSFAKDKENRINIKNGTTLCQKCHNEFHSLYGVQKFTEENYYEYLKIEQYGLVG